MWLYTWATAEPCPPKCCWLCLSASRIDSRRAGAFCSIHRQQSGPEIKAHLRVVVDELYNPLLVVQQSRNCVRRVTLGGNPFVPIVVGIGGVLQLDRFKRRILPRRLIKMSVNTNVFHFFVCLGPIYDERTVRRRKPVFRRSVNRSLPWRQIRALPVLDTPNT